MKDLQLINATSIEDAASILRSSNGKAKLMAGGTDLLGGLKRGIHPNAPEVVINIQTIPDMEYIKEEDGALKIGAQTRLRDIAENEVVKTRYTALAEAARKTASPTLRRMGTIGGNICQETRCWYYRAKYNYFDCKMKDGKECFAATGDNRFHSIFGGVKGCMAVNPSDTAPALVALDAKVVTSKRVIDAEKFWAAHEYGLTALEEDEIVVEIRIPVPAAGTRSAFIKYATRGSIDFPIVNCAVMVSPENTRICLNAVAPNPYRAVLAEEVVKGKVIDEALAEAAGEAAVSKSKPLAKNKFKVQIAKTLVKRALLACQ